MDLTNLKNEIINKIKAKYGIRLEEAKEHQILNVLSEIIMEKIADRYFGDYSWKNLHCSGSGIFCNSQ